MKKHKAQKKKTKPKKTKPKQEQMPLQLVDVIKGNPILHKGNAYFITFTDTKEDYGREVLTIRAVRFMPIHF